jgi:glyoxylase-like metal-dependent hydrolase (beta-lactamase superfamily II)
MRKPFCALVALVAGCGPMTELGIVKAKPSTGGVVHEYSQGSDAGRANIYWFDTQAGPIVVDVPLTTSETKKMRKGMIRPYRIYITEATPTRYGGLQVMRQPDVPAYTTPAIATDIQNHGDQRLAVYRKRVGDDVPTHVDPPTPAVEERIHDVVGEVEVELLPLGPAASEASLAVYLPKTGELIAGDVVGGKTHLDLTWGRSKVWQDRVAELKALEPKLVYPGHGTAGGAELLDETLAYLKFFHNAVADQVKQGKPARISPADAATIKRKMLAQYPKLGRPELLDRSIPAEYAVQLAELAPTGPPADQQAAGGAPGAGGASPAAGAGAGTGAAAAVSSSGSSASGDSGSAGAVDDILGGDSTSKSKKKKAKK